MKTISSLSGIFVENPKWRYGDFYIICKLFEWNDKFSSEFKTKQKMGEESSDRFIKSDLWRALRSIIVKRFYFHFFRKTLENKLLIRKLFTGEFLLSRKNGATLQLDIFTAHYNKPKTHKKGRQEKRCSEFWPHWIKGLQKCSKKKRSSLISLNRQIVELLLR